MTLDMPPAASGFVAVEGVRFHVWRAAPPRRRRTTPALLLHGVPETALAWRALVPELVKDRAVIAPDLKGLGDSEARGPYDVSTLVNELAALVLHEIDGPVDVVGHDWGGVLGLALAAARPDLVRRLVVVNAPYREFSVLRAPHLPFFALPVAPEALFRLGGERVVRGMLRAAWRSEWTLDDEVLDHYCRSYADPQHTAAMLGYYRAATRPRIAQAVDRLVPGRPAAARSARPRSGADGAAADSSSAARIRVERSLVVWGAADPVLPVWVGESVVRDLGANCSMVTLPGVGHFAPEEAPAVVVPTVAEFLRAS
ncbi:MAG TPA: alpha/beta hydrolase [Mycobacteriales bacterium]|nr:alpha/beta hydrolase [Mycobacteriales bacterium]